MRYRITGQERKDLLKNQKGRCAYCGSSMNHIGLSGDDGNRDARWACGIRRMGKSIMVCRQCLPAFRSVKS